MEKGDDRRALHNFRFHAERRTMCLDQFERVLVMFTVALGLADIVQQPGQVEAGAGIGYRGI